MAKAAAKKAPAKGKGKGKAAPASRRKAGGAGTKAAATAAGKAKKATAASSKAVAKKKTAAATAAAKKSASTKAASGSKRKGTATTATADPESLARSKGMVRVYVDGIFDVTHFGHFRLFEQVKKMKPKGKEVFLLVGCCSDELTHKLKGRTVFTDEERYETLRHCRWVDEVIKAAPWFVDQEFLDRHAIDYVAHDDVPYATAGVDDCYKFVKEQGKFLATQRTDGISTSDIIGRVVRNYDMYLLRNLKRGEDRKSLNISRFKEQSVRLGASASDLRKRAQQTQAKVKEVVHGRLEELDDDVTSFLTRVFGFRNRRPKVETREDGSVVRSGHSFKNVTVARPTTCKDCGAILWGISRQGWRCGKCNLIVHERCMETCAPCPRVRSLSSSSK